MSPTRRRTVKALVVLGSLLAFLSVFAIWVERQALNTDDWVSTSGQLIQNKTIRAAVGEYLVDQLYAHVDVEKELKDILPGETKQLAGPAAGGLRQVAGTGAEKILETSTAQGLWQEANRAAHEQLVAVLENKEEGVSTEGGKVTLKLGTLVTNLAKQVGIGAKLAEKLPPDAGQVTVLRSNQLKTAQNIVVAVKGLALILSVLTFLVFALAIYLSRGGRWVTVLFCGVGLVAAGFAVIVARGVVGGILIEELVTKTSVKPAAEATWSIGTSLMVGIATSVIVIGVLFGIAGWLASPTAPARASRRTVAPILRDYAPYVYAALVIVICLYFLSAPIQNLRSFLTTVVIGCLAAFGIHELRRQTAEEFPEAELSGALGRARERLTGAVKSANLGERAAKLRLPEVRGRGAGGPPGAGVPTPEATASAAEADQATTELGRSAAEPGGPAPPAEDLDTRLGRLERLGALREKGVLTDEEFATEKSRLLTGDNGES